MDDQKSLPRVIAMAPLDRIREAEEIIRIVESHPATPATVAFKEIVALVTRRRHTEQLIETMFTDALSGKVPKHFCTYLGELGFFKQLFATGMARLTIEYGEQSGVRNTDEVLPYLKAIRDIVGLDFYPQSASATSMPLVFGRASY